jgi:hypothetical protein
MRSAHWLRWVPRVLGIVVSLFIASFALDGFSQGKPFTDALMDVAIHLTPAAILLVVVTLSFRWEWIGGISFAGLAVAYAVVTRDRPDWTLAIAGPLLIVGVLFLWSWIQGVRARPDTRTP